MSPATTPGGRRADIVKSAQILFAEHGYDGVSLDAIINHSKTSNDTLYHYFESKEDLYTTVLEEMLDRIWQEGYEPNGLEDVTADTFWPWIAKSWRRSTDYLLQHPEQIALWRGFQEGWRTLSDSGPARRLRQRSLSMGMALARRGQELGVIRDDMTPMQCAELVEALDVVTDGWFFVVADTEGAAVAMDRLAPRTLDLIWRLLAPAHEVQAALRDV